jgi:hypothetical protein
MKIFALFRFGEIPTAATSLKRAVNALIFALALAGCAPAARVAPIPEPSGPPKPAARIDDYQDAVQAIGAVLRRDLGLPVPSVSLYLYPDRDAFVRGLGSDLKFEPTLAQDWVSFERGVGGSDKILVNEAGLASAPWPERIRFLAHELTHMIQYDLAGGRRSTSEQWLREGYAEWVSYRVADALGLRPYAQLRATRLRQLQNLRDQKAAPVLSQLSTFPQWLAWRGRQGGEVAFNQVFLAVDFLLERRGNQAAVEYFRLFAQSDDRLAHFRTAFGEDLPAFERELAAHLEGLR